MTMTLAAADMPSIKVSHRDNVLEIALAGRLTAAIRLFDADIRKLENYVRETQLSRSRQR
jgi:hypothetical protein